MTPERWNRVQVLFEQAQALSAAEQAAFLDAVEDPEARQLLKNLLADNDSGRDLFDENTEGRLVSLAQPEDSGVTETIGPYRLLRLLGRGGMGAVYLAQRDDGTFKKRVALKLIRAGLDTHDILQRFRLERQILAALNHPNIARLLDGGMTPDRRPYLVMEYIEGQPLTEYCDAHRLGLDARLELFQTVCQAVHHAHQNLVVHRDLKPDNILVTKGDGTSPEGTVKLLDFGIAKLLNPALGELTAPMTRTDVRLLTPEYASPEQVRGEPVTTASDVYALGVLLYELLTGHRPYRLQQRAIAEMIRVICEEEPMRPSTAVSQVETITHKDGTTHVTPEEVSMARAVSAEQLKRRLRGDLDNVILMALRKEPNRRYRSAEALGVDIDRHLRGLPVNAHRDTVGYRMRKFVIRHRMGVLTSAAVMVVLAGVIAFYTIRLTQERDRAQQESDTAQEISDFLIALFDASDPYSETPGRIDTLRVQTFLHQGAARIEKDLIAQPEMQARLWDVIGQVYRNAGLLDQADQYITRALDTRTRHLAPDHPDWLISLRHMASLRHTQGNYAAADSLFRLVLAGQQRAAGSPEERAETLFQYGKLAYDQSDFPKADSLLNAALVFYRTTFGTTHASVPLILNALASSHYARGAFDEAKQYAQEAFDLGRALYGETHPHTLASLHTLASIAHEDGAYAAAERMYQQILAAGRERFGDRHGRVVMGLTDLGTLYMDQDRYEEAASYFEEAVSLSRHVFGASHPEVAMAKEYLGRLYGSMGRLDEALEIQQQALELRQRLLPPDHIDLGFSYQFVGNIYIEKHQQEVPPIQHTPAVQAELEQAAAFYEKALSIYRKHATSDFLQVAIALEDLGLLYLQLRHFAQAESLLLEAYEIYQQRERIPDYMDHIKASLTNLYTVWGRPAEAAKYR